MPAIQFLLLVISLLFFLFSTRRMKLPLRASVWLVGAAVLGFATWIALSRPGHTGFVAIASDFFAHIGNPEESLLLQSLGGNWSTMGIVIGPMFDAFLMLAILVALFALLAFTPGEGIKRIERPVNIGLVGAIFGGLLALAIASVGFGGVLKRKVYLNTVSAADVIDGDTIRMGDASLRLWGIDAPERDQICRAVDGEPFECGKSAGEHLAGLVVGKLIWCGPPVDEQGRRLPPAELPPLVETFGRPIVTCRLRDGGMETDIAQVMARDGFAHPYEDAYGIKSTYQADVERARNEHLGLHGSDGNGFLAPWLWRNDPAQRCGFLAGIDFEKLSSRLHTSCLGFETPANDSAPAVATAAPPT